MQTRPTIVLSLGMLLNEVNSTPFILKLTAKAKEANQAFQLTSDIQKAAFGLSAQFNQGKDADEFKQELLKLFGIEMDDKEFWTEWNAMLQVGDLPQKLASLKDFSEKENVSVCLYSDTNERHLRKIAEEAKGDVEVTKDSVSLNGFRFYPSCRLKKNRDELIQEVCSQVNEEKNNTTIILGDYNNIQHPAHQKAEKDRFEKISQWCQDNNIHVYAHTKPNTIQETLNQWCFFRLFNQHPMLNRFVTQQIQTSSDYSVVPDQRMPWQKALDQFLFKKQLQKNVRYVELERTLLSMLFLEAMRRGDVKAFAELGKTNLTQNELDQIVALVKEAKIDLAQKDQLQSLMIALIMGDIGKINQIRADFQKHGVFSADQDIALEYILKLDAKILAGYFNLEEKQVDHLQKTHFPMHLGHAVQAECTATKFIEIQKFLLVQDPKQVHQLIAYAILKQILDVAGARAQESSILLNPAILKAYLGLKDRLLALADPNTNPIQVYWEAMTALLPAKVVKDLGVDKLESIETYSESGLTLRLCWQLRATLRPNSTEDSVAQEVKEISTSVSGLLHDQTYESVFDNLRRYDESGFHTFTYGPAIFATLRSQAPAGSENDYAIRLGLKIQSLAIEAYFRAAEKDKSILQSPLCFNQLNELLKKDSALALALAKREVVLKVKPDGNLERNYPLVQSIMNAGSPFASQQHSLAAFCDESSEMKFSLKKR